MQVLRLVFFILFICTFSFLSFSQTDSEIDNMRSDTINIINYNIRMDFTEMVNKKIYASAKISFQSLMDNVDGISLDLLKLDVDSITSPTGLLYYSYNDTLLRVLFEDVMNANEEGEITVHYQGKPTTDESGFGGFYFQNGYSYSIGVGFSAKPHVYGRVWHPCFDNFVERATYDIEIIAPEDNFGYSNGYVVEELVGENGENIIKWKMEEPIPSYLACVGVAPYTSVEDIYVSNIDGAEIPIVLAAKAGDTTKLKESFQHLNDAMDAFQNAYGPYRWNKIGYTIVPFNGGAMEHATTIMYPLFAINGTLQYETLMAHELSHHWWGNLVTCRTAEDMWINEGLSAYSESIFLEHLYGYDEYLRNIKRTHRGVIQNAHYKDGEFLSISGVPHEATYGSHTYDKGATLMHNLRTHMGDEKFFNGLKAIQDEYSFKDIDASEFRDVLTSSTGYDVSNFFDNYIFNPGFNGFEIDSFVVSPAGNEFEVTVYIQQKLFEAPYLFEDVPVQVTFLDEQWNDTSAVTIVSGEYGEFTVILPFHPLMVYLNKDDGLLNAVTGEDILVLGAAVTNLDYAYFQLRVSQEEDSSLVRVEHCRIPPDPFFNAYNNDYVVVSPDRYWKIDGVLSNSFEAAGRISYNAINSAAGNLDNGLMQDYNGITFHEDSIVLLYRQNQSEEWYEFPDYELKTTANKTDGSGMIYINKIYKGEYTFGLKKQSLGLNQLKKESIFNVYPNPTKNHINIDWDKDVKCDLVKIVDSNGRVVKSYSIDSNQINFSVDNLSNGYYKMVFYNRHLYIGSSEFIKE